MSTQPSADLVSQAPPARPAVEPAAAKTPQLNVYTVMLILSFLAICLACLFLYFEFAQYGKIRP